MGQELYIRQRQEEDTLFHQLQQRSLERLQLLCGTVWTDYNVHDPGITIVDVLNYALTELDYRLGFELADYLAPEQEGFRPERYGLFSRTAVFPVSPVTLVDYRKLLIDRIGEVENLWIYPLKEDGKLSGWYEILVELMPGEEAGLREKVCRQIERLFHGNRNLCEGLKRISFVERIPLMLQGDIEIDPAVNVTRMCMKIYWEALQFFVSGIRYQRIEEALAEGKTWDELLDGPDLLHWVVEDTSLKEQPGFYSVSKLYRRLKNLKGVKDIRSLSFKGAGHLFTDFIRPEREGYSYTVLIPVKKDDTGLQLRVGNVGVEPDYTRLPEMLYTQQSRCYGNQNRTTDLSLFVRVPEGKYRNIYTHDSVQNDFPECYGINRMGVAPGDTEHRKAQAAQLKAFLLLFDEVLGRGLQELKEMPCLLDIHKNPGQEGMVSLDAPEVHWQQLTNDVEGMRTNKRNIREKSHWAGVLDRMYGEDSDPVWLRAYNFYEDSEEEVVIRRCRFLSRVPEWGRNRFKGIDLYSNRPDCVPGIKAYVSALLGFQTEREQPVMNVFSLYNLRLIDDGLFYQYQGHLLSHNLVPEELIREENMEDIPLQEKDFTDTDYHLLRDSLPLLHYNLLFEGLFREGIRPGSFHLLNLPLQSDRLLMFYHSERKEWINLGRFGSRQEVFDAANGLRRFLVVLNRKCETLYVVEHLYFSGGPGALTIVLPGWPARFANARFREACEQLICSRLPAHLQVSFRWFAPGQMWEFERLYFEWRRAIAAGNEYGEIAGKLKNVIL